jgi:hypothetical protein
MTTGLHRPVSVKWHDNEARLRRFGKEAAFIGKPAALMAETLTACQRFTGSAEGALYVRAGDEFARAQGSVTGVAARIDGDDSATVAMRTDRVALELADSVAPMMGRTDEL